MNMKKTYLAPKMKQKTCLKLHGMIAISGGETITQTVHDPDEEVDAGDALTKGRWSYDW